MNVETHIVGEAAESGGRDLWSQSRAFIADFTRYAGRGGLVTAALVILGVLLDSAGTLTIVPILAIAYAPRTAAGGSSGGRGMLLRDSEKLLAALHLPPLWALTVLVGVFSAVMIARALVQSWRDNRLLLLRLGFVEERRKRITRRLAAARWEVIARLRHARITHLMSGDIQQIGSAVSCLQQMIVAAAQLVAQCTLAFVLSPLMAAICLAFLALAGWTLGPALRRTRAVGEVVTGGNLALMNTTVQFLGGLKLAVSQNLQSAFVTEFETTLDGMTQTQIDNARYFNNRRLALGTLTALGAAGAILVGFGLLHLPAPIVMTLLFVLARVGGPAMQIQQGAITLVGALPAFRHVNTLEAELAAAADAPSEEVVPPAALDGDIVLHDVRYAHDGQDGAGIDGIDLSIAPGSILGIVGDSGAGKTTLADLLVGLLPPDAGAITVGARPLTGAAVTAWRNRTSYVSQDPYLFHDTIRRNLLWARGDAREEELWQALRVVGADAFVRRMPEGLDTVVGERGARVSGGERQRLALARALLRRPRLLVLDEATNAIDIAGERDILRALTALSPRPTIVMIAHRAESLSICERICRLERGRLVEMPR